MKGKQVLLSERLQALVDMVTPGSRVVDVGCDHGFVAIALVQQEISPHVLAMDVRKGPLAAAKEHIADWKLEEYIETRLSDGFLSYDRGEADTAIIAGMGGKLMMRILQESRDKVEGLSELILQPQSELAAFRHYLSVEGYCILDENILLEDDKYYFLFRVTPPQTTCSYSDETDEQMDPEMAELYEKYGRLLLERKHPVLRQYLLRELGLMEEIRESLLDNPTQRARNRFIEVEKDIELIHRALGFYEL